MTFSVLIILIFCLPVPVCGFVNTGAVCAALEWN